MCIRDRTGTSAAARTTFGADQEPSPASIKKSTSGSGTRGAATADIESVERESERDAASGTGCGYTGADATVLECLRK